MTLYQELQLNQAGSKQLIRNTQDKKEKARHIAVYLFKILLTLAFCVAFVTVYTKVFGSDNSIVGVVVLLSVMTFRFADFGIHAPHALSSLMVIWGIMTFGPRLANAGNLVTELIVNMVCIFTLMILGCHNVVMFNQSTLLLGYLLLYGYDVSGTQYLQRIAGMAVGGILTGIVFYRNHRHQKYKRTCVIFLRNLTFHSSRTRWQICVTGGIQRDLFCRTVWIAESDVGRNCGDVGTGTVSCRYERKDQGKNSGKYLRRPDIYCVISGTSGIYVFSDRYSGRDRSRALSYLWMAGSI